MFSEFWMVGRGFKKIGQRYQDRITSKAYARLQALAWQQRGEKLTYVNGKIERPRGDLFDGIELACGFRNKSDWDRLITANAEIDFDGIEMQSTTDQPDWYRYEYPSLWWPPTFNVKYSPGWDGKPIVDLGRITA